MIGWHPKERLSVMTKILILACLILGLTAPVAAQASDAMPPPDMVDAGAVVETVAADAAVVVADVPVPAGPIDPVTKATSDPGGVVLDMVKAAKSGQWRLVASLLLGLLMMTLSKFRSHLKVFNGDRGGSVLVMILAMGGAFASALATDAKIDWRLFVGAAGVAWTAVGGYTWIKRLIKPADKPPQPTPSVPTGI